MSDYDGSYIDEIMSSYEETPSPIDSCYDTTDLQGSGISESYKNDETKEYDKDHSSSWRHTIATIKLKLSGL